MQDKARVNKERLKGLATMGRHPSRDEIASEDYWGEAVSVVRLFTPVRVWLGICVCERAHACLYVRVCVQRGGWTGGAGLMAAPLDGEQGRLTGCSHSLFCRSHL